MHKGSTTLAGLALAGCALLAGCGSTPARGISSLGQVSPPVTSAPPASTPATAPPVTHTPKPPKPSAPTPSAPPTPAQGPAGPPCTTRSVHVTAGQEQGAAGTSVTTFTVVNTGTGPCEMDGWPFIAPTGR